jgi:sterol 3beta-glucosyltransferase/vancomycin aglycone glucosyltransferase
MADAVPDDLDAFLSAGSPPVYLTFGSMMINNADYLSEVASIWQEATRRVGCRAIIQLPWGDVSRFSSSPDVFVVRRSPYNKVFPRCSMIVHHGGAGTTQSSLLAGRPSIVVAHVSDQFFWGSELERLGVGGTTLRRRGLKPRQLARGISRVLATATLTERAIALGERMSGEDGVAIAIQLIEKSLV